MTRLTTVEEVKDTLSKVYIELKINYCKEYYYQIVRCNDIHHIYYCAKDGRMYTGFYFDDLYFTPAPEYRHNLRNAHPAFVRTIRTLLDNTKENKFDNRMEVYYVD